MESPSITHLTAKQVAELDPYAFLAVLGKRVIHPGGRRTSEELFRRAGLSNTQVISGPFEMMTPAGFLSDEGVANCLAIMGRTMTRMSYLRKMAWLMPRLQRAVPYLGYLLVVGEKPAIVQGAVVAQSDEAAEGLSPERMS